MARLLTDMHASNAPAGLQLADPASGALFSVPHSSWTALSKRVGLARMAGGIADIIARYMVDFPGLDSACRLWATSTFPGLVTLAGDIASYAGLAVVDLSMLEALRAALPPGAALPAGSIMATRRSFARLLLGSERLGEQSSRLLQEVHAFAAENLLADVQVRQYVVRFGPLWQPLTMDVQAVEAACTAVEAGWCAMAEELRHFASGCTPITGALLAPLDLRTAILSWKNMAQEAAAFVAMTEGQRYYLSGDWLSRLSELGPEGHLPPFMVTLTEQRGTP